jgi:YD repeat-containing protein
MSRPITIRSRPTARPGKLLTLADRAGRTTSLKYDLSIASGGDGDSSTLDAVTDHVGRQLRFSYDGNKRIASVTDPAGDVIIYGYDVRGNLVTVQYPGGHTRTYHYNEASHTSGVDLPHALTGITDENGDRFATFEYDATGRAIATGHANGADLYTLSYGANATTVTDPLGTQRTRTFQTIVGAARSTGQSQPGGAGCGPSSSGLAYDANANIASRTDFNGKKTCYAYDTGRNLETARVEGLLVSESCSAALASPPGRPDVRWVNTAWHATFRLPTTITEPVAGGTRTTSFSYDGSGNLLQKTITGPKNDGSGAAISRTWIWTYTTLGRVETAKDPNNNATTYAYHADNDPNLGKRGQLASITNAAGHITQVTAYDANGRPLTIIDPNGAITQLTYHARGWLISRTVGGEQTTYGYDHAGQVTSVTLPDGSTLAYEYDAAHRLVAIADGLGNSIAYTLDNMGNRTREDIYDPGDQLVRTRSRTFDALNRLASDIGAINQATTYAYDSNGNRLTALDPHNHQTSNAYDAVNRLRSVTDPANGATTYAYDPAGNLAQVTDPRTLTTTYTHDGIGSLVSQRSPDSGTTTQTYDAGGRLATKLDARGVTATYSYDALNRVTQLAFTQSGRSTETQQFGYDTGTNGKGRLTNLTDPVATTTWSYTAQGRVASKSQLVSGVTQAVGYGYNSAGQLTSITTPSGQVIGYAYFNNRIAGITVNGTSLISGVVATPFGPVGAWQWGNGLATFRDYDSDGRLKDWEFRNGVSVLRQELAGTRPIASLRSPIRRTPRSRAVTSTTRSIG